MAIPSLSRVESPLPLNVLCVLLCDAKMFGCPSIYATLACRSSWMVMGLSLSLSSSGKCLVLVGPYNATRSWHLDAARLEKVGFVGNNSKSSAKTFYIIP